MEQPSTTSASQPVKNPDEINLLEYIYVLVKHKKLIIGLTILGLAVGYIAALIKGPTWVAETIIAPKEKESQRSTSLADLGAIGGLMASQLNLDVGTASLNMMDMILDSRDFGAKLIEKYTVLPSLYKYQWPKVYRKYWNPTQNNWKSAFVQPNLLSLGGFIKATFLKKTKDNKKNTLTLRVQSKDSSFTSNLSALYLVYLSEYIKIKVQNEAKENVAYLDSQLVRTADPLLQSKIQGLVANEIEKEMVVSREAFKIVDPIYLSKTFKEKKLFPSIFGLGFFFISCIAVLFLHIVALSPKTQEDRNMINKIMKEVSWRSWA
jgi:hypothetical protein